MRIADMNWMQVESYLKTDDRVVLPLGSVEQHATLSLATDALLAERVAVEAAEPLGVPVYPALAFGVAPYFMAYPGTVTLRPRTYAGVIRDLMDSLAASGFRRLLLVNGHGGNAAAEETIARWRQERSEVSVRVHHWWRAPQTLAAVRALDPVAAHGSWMENFPWTRLSGVAAPREAKPPVELPGGAPLSAREMRERLGDGSYGGAYQRADDDMRALWHIAVEETRAALMGPWAPDEEELP